MWIRQISFGVQYVVLNSNKNLPSKNCNLSINVLSKGFEKRKLSSSISILRGGGKITFVALQFLHLSRAMSLLKYSSTNHVLFSQKSISYIFDAFNGFLPPLNVPNEKSGKFFYSFSKLAKRLVTPSFAFWCEVDFTQIVRHAFISKVWGDCQSRGMDLNIKVMMRCQSLETHYSRSTHYFAI